MLDTVTQVAPSEQQRWRTCLHEAGHVVAGAMLMRNTSSAAVFSDGGGIAGLGGNNGIPESDEEAIAVAAGSAAEILANDQQPSQVQRLLSLEERYSEQASHAKAERDACMSDEEAIARWCVRGFESRPYHWIRRYNHLCERAASFVELCTKEILEAATTLFGHGIVTLPATPAKKEEDHAD